MSRTATMGPRLRKLTVFLHVTTSLGWFGAAIAYIGLGVLVIRADSVGEVQALYHAMADSVRFVILPLGIASAVTGLTVSLGTVWGLFRHYWVVAKLVITVVSLVVLLVYTELIGVMVDDADAATTPAGLGTLQSPGILSHVSAGVFLLLVAAWLGVYKPKGQTRWWRRRQWERRQAGKRQQQPAESVPPVPARPNGLRFRASRTGNAA